MATATKATTGKRRGRTPDRDRFLRELKRLAGTDNHTVGNKSLLEALDWTREKYMVIKDQLVREGMLVIGRGYGGTVQLAPTPALQDLTAFISYAHEDRAMKNDLLKHLKPLERLNLIRTWHDGEILPGTDWRAAIKEQLESAPIIVLLVSIDFINSDFCWEQELEVALERHESGDARVIPVILGSCLWQQTPLSRLQALPQEGRPVASWADRDEALALVAEGIRQAADSWLKGDTH